MQPNQPSPAPPPLDPRNTQQPAANPYDFITNPGTAPKKKAISLPAGNSKMQKIAVIGIGVVVLIMLAVVVSSFLGSGDKAKKEQLISVVAQQKELIRISEIGIKKSKTTEAKNLAVTTQITLVSEQPELYSALKKLGVKTDSKTIGGTNKKTDAELTAAEQANNFDAVFMKTLQEDLLKYAKAVQIAYKNNSSKSTKSALELQYKNAATLAGFKEE